MNYNAYEIGLRAYHARQNLSKKQCDVSEAIGTSQAAYSRFETGQCDIPLSKAIKLCKYLGISISYLIGEDESPKLTEQERLELEQYKKYLISKRK